MTIRDPSVTPAIINRLDKFHDESTYLLTQVIQTLELLINNEEPAWEKSDQIMYILMGFRDKLKTARKLSLDLELPS